MGTSPKGYTYNSVGEGLPLLNGPTEFGNKYPECTSFTTASVKECQPGDLIFCVRGSTTGRMNWADKTYSLGRGVCSIRGQSQVDTKFIRYCLDYKLQGLLQLAGGTTFPNLSQDTIKNFSIPFPDNHQEITETLTAYDDLIENNRRRITLLEESARLLYQEWFVHLRFPGHEHIKITNGIPEGWESKTLIDICSELREIVMPEDLEPNTPYIGLEHMPRRSISLSEWGQAETVTSSKHQYKKGDIIFGKIRPYFHKVGIAFNDGVASSDAIVLRPHSDDIQSLVLMVVSSDKFVAEASQTMKEGSKMPRADWKLMAKYPIAIPPKGLLADFTENITANTDQLCNLCFQNQKLKAARDILLPRLISGEIAV